MSNIMAAIGIEQLKSLSVMAEKRQCLARRYDERFCGHPKIQILMKDYDVVVPHIYVVRITGMINRKLLQEQLLGLGIQTGIHYQPNHLLSFYSIKASLPLPITNSIYPELLSLPLHPDLNEEDVDFVCETLKELLK
jgi:dTDP-4-amino-4,6-dideoxygalactose transaminase